MLRPVLSPHVCYGGEGALCTLPMGPHPHIHLGGCLAPKPAPGLPAACMRAEEEEEEEEGAAGPTGGQPRGRRAGPVMEQNVPECAGLGIC